MMRDSGGTKELDLLKKAFRAAARLILNYQRTMATGSQRMPGITLVSRWTPEGGDCALAVSSGAIPD